MRKIVFDCVQTVAQCLQALRGVTESYSFSELALGVLFAYLDPTRQTGYIRTLLNQGAELGTLLLFDPAALFTNQRPCLGFPLFCRKERIFRRPPFVRPIHMLTREVVAYLGVSRHTAELAGREDTDDLVNRLAIAYL